MIRKRYPNAKIIKHGGEMFIHDGLTMQIECNTFQCWELKENVEKLADEIRKKLINYNARVSVISFETALTRKYIIELDIIIYKTCRRTS